MNRLLKKNTILFFFLAGIVLLMASGIIFYMQFQRVLQVNAASVTSNQILRAANGAILSIDDAAIEVGAFLQSGDQNYIKNLSEIIIAAQVNLTALDQLTRDDIHQQNLFKQLVPLTDKKIEFLRKIIAYSMAGDTKAALEVASDNNRLALSRQIKQLIILIKRLEVVQLNNTDIQYKSDLKTATLFYLSAGMLCVLLFLFTYIILRKYLR